MELRRFPPEVALIIWSNLSTTEHVRLYATFDRALHRSLVNVTHVSTNTGVTEADHDTNLFLRQLRKITTLKDSGLGVGERELLLYAALNPIQVSLARADIADNYLTNTAPTTSEVREELERYKAKISKLSTPLGLIDFARVFPHLQTLRITTSIPSTFALNSRAGLNLQADNVNWSKLVSFPPSLTSLSIQFHEPGPLKILATLPPTLQALTIRLPTDFNVSLPAVLSQMPRLKKLHILSWESELSIPDEGFRLPPTLTDLKLTGFTSIDPNLMQCLRGSTGLRKLSLNRVCFGRRESEEIVDSVSKALPPTLTDFHFNVHFEFLLRDFVLSFSNLPSALTRLRIAAPDAAAGIRLPSASLNCLSCLTHLELRFNLPSSLTRGLCLYSSPTESKDAIECKSIARNRIFMIPWNVMRFPRTLTTLKLVNTRIKTATKAAIKDLPTNLVSLYTPKMNLQLAAEIRATHPKLTVIFTDPIKLWSSSCGRKLQAEFSNLWSPVLDVEAFEAAVITQYSLRKVLLALSMDTGGQVLHKTVRSLKDISTLISRPTTFLNPGKDRLPFPDPKFIQSYFPALVRLVMWLPSPNHQTFDASLLPRSLTELDIRNFGINGNSAPLNNLLCIHSTGACLASPPLVLDEMAVVHLDAPLWEVSSKGEDTLEGRVFSCFNVKVVPYTPPKKQPTASESDVATVLPPKNPTPSEPPKGKNPSKNCAVS